MARLEGIEARQARPLQTRHTRRAVLRGASWWVISSFILLAATTIGVNRILNDPNSTEALSAYEKQLTLQQGRFTAQSAEGWVARLRQPGLVFRNSGPHFDLEPEKDINFESVGVNSSNTGISFGEYTTHEEYPRRVPRLYVSDPLDPNRRVTYLVDVELPLGREFGVWEFKKSRAPNGYEASMFVGITRDPNREIYRFQVKELTKNSTPGV